LFSLNCPELEALFRPLFLVDYETIFQIVKILDPIRRLFAYFDGKNHPKNTHKIFPERLIFKLAQANNLPSQLFATKNGLI
jgi:hypothetical protein